MKKYKKLFAVGVFCAVFAGISVPSATAITESTCAPYTHTLGKKTRTTAKWLRVSKIGEICSICNVPMSVRYVEPNYEVNANGETYGTNSLHCLVHHVRYWPDLQAAVGDNWVEGYVRNSELNEPAPSSPEEALRQQLEHERNGRPLRTINLYESDGVTVIDTFTFGGGR
jgi:hypothetical protein